MPAPLGNNNGHRVNAWPLEHDDALQVLFAGGMSSSQIAETLNQRFRSHYTRNAVIGRRIRMGIKCVDPQRSSRRPKGPAEPKLWDMAGISKRQYQRRRAAVVAIPEPHALHCMPIEPRNVTFNDLGLEDCKFPYGGEAVPIVFCGHMRAPKDAWGTRPPYCRHHQAVARR